MLPNMDIQGARNIAEKIRKATAEQRFHMAGQEFSVTMTFGLSQHKENDSIDDSLNRADEALYQGRKPDAIWPWDDWPECRLF